MIDSPRAPDSKLSKRPKVLVFAYAAEPGGGSEPGAGWGLVQALGDFARGVVLVAPEHVPAIRRWEAEHPGFPLEFVEVPERGPARLVRRHRILWFSLYLAWLRRAATVGREIHEREPFDAVFHATYSTYWLPAPATRFGRPSVWGPVGGAVRTPLRLWPLLGWSGVLDELLDLVAVRAAALWPSTRRTWRHASTRVVQNEETRARLPSGLRRDTHVLNHALFVEGPPVASRAAEDYLLYVSPLESRKGPGLALRALAHAAPDVRLRVVGDGPQRAALERLAARLGVSDRVTFLGRVPRDEVFALLAGAEAAVFTGLREEGGMALAEAMLCGTPVIVLANGGARTLAEAATDRTRATLIPPRGVEETARDIGTAMSRIHRAPPTDRSPNLDQASARRALRRIFEEALGP